MTKEFSCPFCQIVDGKDKEVREVARNREVVAFFPDRPAALGHCMVIPHRHVTTLDLLTEQELRELMLAVKQMVPAVLATSNAEGFNIIQSNGSAAGQTVDHVHVHIVPRKTDDQIREFWPKELLLGDNQIERALVDIRNERPVLSGDSSEADFRQHLQFLQDVIARMAQASERAKSWLLPVATAAYGYALTQNSNAVAWLGMIATSIFWFLDASYLSNERRFRDLYARVLEGGHEIPRFSLDCRTAGETIWTRTWMRIRAATAWSIFPIYATLMGIGVCALMLNIVS